MAKLGGPTLPTFGIGSLPHKGKKYVIDKFHDECGLMAVWNHAEAANLTYLGLYAQQHRGQEGAGVVSLNTEFDSHAMRIHKGLGLVADVFKKFNFEKLPGEQAIGHVRYTTAGGNRLSNVQPFMAEISSGRVAIAHNGNLINAELLRSRLIDSGAIFGTTSDTEVILHLLANAPKDSSPVDTLRQALSEIRGAYSLLVLFRDRLFAVRDPNGLRPLAVGKLGDATIVASETCAFDLIDAEYVRDIQPGEILEIHLDGTEVSHQFGNGTKPSPCIFEYVYFARPDSRVFGRNVYPIRKAFGAELAREFPVSKADMVCAVPDSGLPAAMGFAEASGIPLELGLIRNHYVGRTFIEPQQSIRDFGVKIKLNPNADLMRGKSIVVVDDSLVRGTTSRKLVKMLRKAGAREVHVRISSPPTLGPCFYGIDTPAKGELIASEKSIEEIRDFIEADSLAYLSIEGMYNVVNSKRGTFCDACFSGIYPIGVPGDHPVTPL